MREPVHYLPILTTLIALPFAVALFRRYRQRPDSLHLLWWSIGVLLYAVGTFTEAAVTIVGWREPLFRAWYIAGALLGGAPLAQGTVYLLLPRRTAHWLAGLLIAFVAVAATFVLLTPLDATLVETHRLTGRVMQWQWVRAFSPIVNLYAVIFLIGGALYSAARFRVDPENQHRFTGNVLIAAGAILPGIGGTATRMGHTEVLYVMELVGIILIWLGYRANIGLLRLGGNAIPGAGTAPFPWRGSPRSIQPRLPTSNLSTRPNEAPMRKQRKKFVIGLTAVVMVGAGLATVLHARAAEAIMVYQSPTCGCCGEWVEHLEAHGFRVKVDKTGNMAVVKSQYGVPGPATSCHTGIVGGYVIEGHVPADQIARMLRERPEIAGLAVPGMPMGSPGMEGPYQDPYDVIAFTADGRGYVYDSR